MANIASPQEANKVREKTWRPRAMELCCGHAGLSAALQAMGWDTRPVDWAGNRHKTSIPVLQRDLTDPEEVAKIIKLLKTFGFSLMQGYLRHTGGVGHLLSGSDARANEIRDT